MRIAFVEDDEVLGSNYSDLLVSEGYDVHLMKTYNEAFESILDISPDLAILDVVLPDDPSGGIKICKLLRAQDIQIPVIFLTSHTELDRQSMSWRAGADDYVTKDTSIELVLLRVRVLIERYEAIRRKAQQEQKPSTGLSIDRDRLAASWEGTLLDLSLTQFWVLEALVSKSGSVVSHSELSRAAGVVVESNTIAAYIKAIRSAFTDIEPNLQPIVTERGKGYRWID